MDFLDYPMNADMQKLVQKWLVQARDMPQPLPLPVCITCKTPV